MSGDIVKVEDSAGAEVLGTASADPAENTLLYWLKTIADNTAVLAP